MMVAHTLLLSAASMTIRKLSDRWCNLFRVDFESFLAYHPSRTHLLQSCS
jgi:hypothetical protein